MSFDVKSGALYECSDSPYAFFGSFCGIRNGFVNRPLSSICVKYKLAYRPSNRFEAKSIQRLFALQLWKPSVSEEFISSIFLTPPVSMSIIHKSDSALFTGFVPKSEVQNTIHFPS